MSVLQVIHICSLDEKTIKIRGKTHMKIWKNSQRLNWSAE